MSEQLSDCDSVSTEKSEFRPSLKYLLTGWRLKNPTTSSTFSYSQERKLCRLILEKWRSRNYMTPEQLQLAAFSLAKECSLKVPSQWNKTGRASDKWLRMFLQRHSNMRDLLMRKPGVPPKRVHKLSEGEQRSDSSSDFSSSDESEGLCSDSEVDDEESMRASSQELFLDESLQLLAESNPVNTGGNDEQRPNEGVAPLTPDVNIPDVNTPADEVQQ